MDISCGASIHSTSKSRGIPMSTLVRWVEKSKIESYHERPSAFVTDTMIVETITIFGVMTERELEHYFGYAHNSVHRRLKKLVMDGKLSVTRIPASNSKIIKKYFRGYIDRKLYYTGDRIKHFVHALIDDAPPTEYNCLRAYMRHVL